MDPFSLTAGTIGILVGAIDICRLLLRYYGSACDYTDQIQPTVSSIKNFQDILIVIERCITDAKLSHEEKTMIESSINSCEKSLRVLEKKFAKFSMSEPLEQDGARDPESAVISKKGSSVWSSRRVRATVAILAYPFRESTLAKLRETVAEMKQNLQLAIEVLNLNSSEEQRSTMETVKTQVDSLVSSVQNTTNGKIFRWFFPNDWSYQHSQAQSKHHSGTGTWLLENPQLDKWMENPGSVFWIHGIPGCGKTVLISAVIEHIRQTMTVNSAVAYYYFRFDDDRTMSVSNLLGSIIVQLCVIDAATALPLLEKTYQSQPSCHGSRPSLSILTITLKELLKLHQREVYLVVDALDECSNYAELENWLVDVKSWRFDWVHMLVTSRRVPHVENSLENLGCRQLAVQNSSVDADISIFLSSTLSNEKGFRRIPPQLRNEVQQKLVQGAHGMFQWVACMLDTLRDCYSTSDVVQALNEMPLGLDAVYDRLLGCIKGRNQQAVVVILKCLGSSYRPLRLEELAEFLALDLGWLPTLNLTTMNAATGRVTGETHPSSKLFDKDRRLWDPEDLLKLCPSILSLVPGTYYDPVSESRKDCLHIQVSHFSIMEYLTSGKAADSPSALYSFTEESAHEAIAAGCCSYFIGVGLQDPAYLRRGRDAHHDYPLLHYASAHWLQHMRAASSTDFTSLSRQACTKLFSPEEYFRSAMIMCDFEDVLNCDVVNPFGRDPKTIGSPLYYAAFLGLRDVAEDLLERDANPDIRGGIHGTPLSAAAYRGHQEIVTLLLERHANINLEDNMRTPLEAAARSGHFEVAKILLDHGANPHHILDASSCSTCYEISTPEGKKKVEGDLHLGVNLGSMFLQFAQTDFRMATALQAAAGAGHVDIVRLLLRHLQAGGRDKSLDYAGRFAFRVDVTYEGAHTIWLVWPEDEPITALDAACSSFFKGFKTTNGKPVSVFANDPSIAEVLLEAGAAVSRQIYVRLARSLIPADGKSRLLELLLPKTEFAITNEAAVAQELVQLKSEDPRALDVFLDKFQECWTVSEELLCVAARCGSRTLFEKIWQRSPCGTPPKSLLLNAISNRGDGADIIKIIIGDTHERWTIDEDLLLAVCGNTSCGSTIFGLLRDYNREMVITPKLLISAASSDNYRVLTCFMEYDLAIGITEDLVCATMSSSFITWGIPRSLSVMLSLLGCCPSRHWREINESWKQRLDALRQMHKEHYGLEYTVDIGESTLLNALTTPHFESPVLDLVIESWGKGIQATEKSGAQALKSEYHPDKALKKLLDMPNGILLTSAVDETLNGRCPRGTRLFGEDFGLAKDLFSEMITYISRASGPAVGLERSVAEKGSVCWTDLYGLFSRPKITKIWRSGGRQH
ncbi:hypothetical protein EDB81DRAFT_832722 [Dactylonectria macrodidyma]|uniref:Nephrocystin 3-like N-terminal domain-containing protein n=1 Tax=Dactylonectria macrodidyma TaxID=307937 RepID=A0A9P9I855_9HYPO|nr:hypothetical protein EDB81DRAFT_832722 [Dactylonectria macrodidyma]